MKTLVERLVTPPPCAPSCTNTAQAFVDADTYQKTFTCSGNSEMGHMKHVTVHPSLPQVAYCLELPQVEKSTIVVQDTQSHSLNVLFAVSVKELMQATKEFHGIQLTGPVLSLEFFNAATLFYSGTTTMDTHNSSMLKSVQRTKFQALLIQFLQCIVICNIKPIQHRILPGLSSKNTTKKTNKNDLILACIHQVTLDKGTPPTTNALPMTPSIILVGCMDGTLRLYDFTTHKVLKSVRGPPLLDKKDYLVHLLATNPNSNLYLEKPSIRRVVATSHKGIAILWEFVFSDSDVVDIRPPVARMEGHALPNNSIVKFSYKEQQGSSSSEKTTTTGPSPSHASITTTDTTTSSVVSSPSAASTEHVSYLQHSVLKYDPHRNLLFWYICSGYKGSGSSSSRPHLLCWNLSIRVKTSTNNKVPQHDPFLVVALPKDLNSDFHCGRVLVQAGWLHPSFPDSFITCAVATHLGDVYVFSCSTSNSGTSTSTTTKKKNSTTYVKDPICWHLFNVGTLLDVPTQVHSLSTVQDSCSLLVGTNRGLLSVKLLSNEGMPWAGSTLHQYLLENEVKTDTNHGSVLWVQQSCVYWAPLAKSDKNPVGYMRIYPTPQVLYQSPTGGVLPSSSSQDIVRLPPRFLKSPSHNYVCLFWQEESRYEILHLPSLLKRRLVGGTSPSNSSSNYSPAVATGTGVVSFCWVGNNDHFCLLYPQQKESQQSNFLGSNRSLETSSTTTTLSSSSSSSSFSSSQNKDHVGSSGKLRIRKSFNFNKIEKVMQRTKSNLMSPDGSSSNNQATPMPSIVTILPPTPEGSTVPSSLDPSSKLLTAARVELKVLVAVKAGAAEYSGSIAAATATTCGHVELRSRQQQTPSRLFGGPVLCVASKGNGDRDGTAHFYSRKPSSEVDATLSQGTLFNASDLVSSGPTLPYPDLVGWNDDGRLCAIVYGNRVAVYLSDQPTFALLGTSVLLGGSPSPSSTADSNVVTSVKFIHGVLYCATKTSVQCIFLGDLERPDGICQMDSFLLASKDVPCLPCKNVIFSDACTSWSPPTIPMALNYPSILGYQRGSLLLSTVSGLHAVPLRHPLLRLGTLLAAGHRDGARKWLHAFPESDHEALAAFLDRRGVPEMALQDLGLSIETIVDFCMRHDFADKLEQVIETHGLECIRQIDMGRGIKPWAWGQDQGGHSMVVCVGAYFLQKGKTELVRQLATESISSKYGKRDAFTLAAMLLRIDQSDARRLMKRAVARSEKEDQTSETRDPTYDLGEWPVATLIREKLL